MKDKPVPPDPVSGFSQSRTHPRPESAIQRELINSLLCTAFSEMAPGGLILKLHEINTIVGICVHARNRQTEKV